MTHIEHDIVNHFRIHDLDALFVDDLTLVIHHVVILDDLFADIVVPCLDLFLRGLDCFRKPFGPDRLAIGKVRIHHLGEQGIWTKDPQQIIFEAQVEP